VTTSRAKKLAAVADVSPIEAPPSAFPTIGPEEIFAPLPPIQWIVEGLDLCAGPPAMFAGYGYSGKTTAAQSLALSVAAQLPHAWNCFRCAGGRVVHIDYEQGARLTREKYQRMARALAISPSDVRERLAVSVHPPTYFDQPGVEDHLCRLLDGATLAIVDSMRAASPSLDENASDVRRVLDALARVSERTGCAPVMIHHARKPSQQAAGGAKMAIRGSGAIFDACSSVLVFEAEKGEPTRVSHEKAKATGRLAADFLLRIDDVEIDGNPRGGLVVTAESAPDRASQSDEFEKVKRKAAIERCRAELRVLFGATPEQGGADAIAARVGRKVTDVRAALRLMVEDGEVNASGSTSNRRHKWLGRE
jgi:hypothetical protein